MKKIVVLSFILGLTFSFYSEAIAQKKVTLSGYIKDAASGEELIGASVVVEELTQGTITNLYGFYSLSLAPGTYTIKYSYLGYESISEQMDLQENISKNVELSTAQVMLKELVISDKVEDQNVTSIEMSVEKMDMKTVEKIPQLLGEADIIRSIQLLPGITTVGEGATGFNVRGGAVDQNLILLDEAPVYNSSHLFGFFSVFNSDAIKDLQLYKGGIPAQYGGRLSSVMDVRQREGNMKKFSASGGISPISSRLTLEAPIVKNKSSFMLAGRRSYGDLFLKFDEDLKDNTAFFYDLNAKVNYIINDNNRLFVSGYLGDDVFKFGDQFKFKWGNQTATVRWNHLFSDKLFSNFTGVYSDFSYILGVPTGTTAFEWESHVINYNAKADFSFFPNPNNTVDFGAQALIYRFQPGEAKGVGDNTIFNEIKLQHQHAIEPSIYISNEQKVTGRLTLQYGLRYSLFLNVGKTIVNEYVDGKPTDPDDITGQRTYDRGEVVAQYGGLEPRFSANYLLNEFSSLKLSYNRTRQYIHLVSNTTSATPIDVWMPSGKYVEPATADQVAMGYFRNFKENKYEASVEVYYKQFQDLLDYKDGAELLLNETIETEFLSGIGRAYGAEFQVKKQQGRTTGWISYTLARSERQIDGINNDKYYPSNYDKLHDITVVLNYQLNDKWEASTNFAYMTGRPITYPDSRYVYDGKVVAHYNNRNGARTPAYHRLDIAFTYDMPMKKIFWFKKPTTWPVFRSLAKGENKLVFSAYNVYRRRNPYSIFFRQQAENPQQTEAVRLSIFGEIIPSITYNFRF